MDDREMSPSPLSCLVMTFGARGVGDHVSCSSFVRNLAKNSPNAAIDVGVFSPVGMELFKYNPHVRNIHMLDMDYLKLGGKYRCGEKARYIGSFRGLNYDKVYILGTKFRHGVFAFLIGARNRIGYSNYRRGFLLTTKATEPLEKNIVERFLGLLVLDGLTVFDPSPELFISEKEVASVERLFAERGVLSTDHAISLAPFAADMRRTWGLHRFWEIADRFAEEGWKILVFGSSSDRELTRNIPLFQHPNIVDLTGKLTILETAAAMKKSVIFLGNDSGLGHIAGAVGTKALILGYYVTRTWYPLAPSVRTIIKEIGCTACNLNTCTANNDEIPRCFSAIEVEEVVQTLTEMLRDNSSAQVSTRG